MVATGLTANIVDQNKIITRLTKLTSENTLAPLLQLRGEYTSWNQLISAILYLGETSLVGGDDLFG